MSRKRIKKNPRNKVLESEAKQINATLVRAFISDNRNATSLQLAKKLKLSYVQFEAITRKSGIEEINKTDQLSTDQLDALTDFFSSRLSALARKKSLLNQQKKADIKKRKQKIKYKSSLGGKSVYDKIKLNGGLGKLIYNSMKG